MYSLKNARVSAGLVYKVRHELQVFQACLMPKKTRPPNLASEEISTSVTKFGRVGCLYSFIYMFVHFTCGGQAKCE